ncbi:MAG TPA: DUF2344 domain-containing protein [Clostridiaceae bacterium]|nr:DUF2344 domain-containing protein [Clostridiaceae bacterium]
MGKIRFKFIRGEQVKYISHLDMMKTFERAIRRANIPVKYSQGFNPHPQLVFGLPLSVGVTSEAEYADIEIDGELAPSVFLQQLNTQLPEGLKVTDAKESRAKSNIMASVAFASYDIFIKTGLDALELQEKLDEFMKSESVVVKKESKSKVRDVDIKPMIHRLELTNYEKGKSTVCISAFLSAGSSANLKPELLFSALKEKSMPDIRLAGIHRTGLFISGKGKMVDPLDPDVLKG